MFGWISKWSYEKFGPEKPKRIYCCADLDNFWTKHSKRILVLLTILVLIVYNVLHLHKSFAAITEIVSTYSFSGLLAHIIVNIYAAFNEMPWYDGPFLTKLKISFTKKFDSKGFIIACCLCFIIVVYVFEHYHSLPINVILYSVLLETLMSEKRNCSIGHALAMSYYFGFLKHCLPPGKDSSQTSIKTRMENYEAKQNHLKFKMYKLFILIPKSCRMSGDLENFNNDDCNFESLGCNGCLISEGIDRCGVKGRKYKNSVYKVTRSCTKESFYCTAEAATPLQTLFEMLNDVRANDGMTISELTVQRKNFVRSLKDILAHEPNVGDLCTIIEFDDRNEESQRVRLSDIIVDHIDKKNMIPITIQEMTD